MDSNKYLELKARRRELADRLDQGTATPEERAEYETIVARFQADPPTPAQVYLGIAV